MEDVGGMTYNPVCDGGRGVGKEMRGGGRGKDGSRVVISYEERVPRATVAVLIVTPWIVLQMCWNKAHPAQLCG